MENTRKALLQSRPSPIAVLSPQKNQLLPSKSDEKLGKALFTGQRHNVFDPRSPGSPGGNKRVLLDKLLHIKTNVGKRRLLQEPESPLEPRAEVKSPQKTNINHLRSLLEDFRSVIEKTNRPTHTRVFGCVEKDYVLSLSNSNSLISAALSGHSPGALSGKKKLEGNRSKDFALKVENSAGPIRLNKKVIQPAPKSKVEAKGEAKAEFQVPTPKLEKRRKLLSSSNLQTLHNVVEPQLDESLNIESRFNLALKKNSSMSKSIKKKLKTSLDDDKNLLKSGLREAICVAKDDLDQSLMIGGQLDSSIEREVWPEDCTEENLDEINLGKVDSSGYDNTLLKVTQGSTPNASKLFSNKHQPSPSRSKISHQQNSFFEESIVLSKKEQILIKIDSHHRYSMATEYYFSKLLQADHHQKDLFNDHFELTAKSYLLASKLNSSPDSFLVQKMVYLPPNPQRKKTLILDLDETLVHCNDSLEDPYDHLINIKLADGDIIDVGINLRPGLQTFLKQVSRYYEIVIFTASQSFYANEVLNIVDPSNELISYRLFHDHCYKSQGGHLIKDLRIIKNRDLANMVLVDNAAYSYAMQTENGVPIVPFFDDKNDSELVELSVYLSELAKAANVRETIIRDFHVELFKSHCSEPTVLKEKILSCRKR